MGCAASQDKPGNEEEQMAKYRSSAERRRRLEQASQTSNVDRLHDELDLRSVSHFAAAEEPTDAKRKGVWDDLVARGRKNDINGDVNQFPPGDIPEFKKRDRRRVEEWTRSVDQALNRHCGGVPLPLPDDGMEYTAEEMQAIVARDKALAAMGGSDENSQHHHGTAGGMGDQSLSTGGSSRQQSSAWAQCAVVQQSDRTISDVELSMRTTTDAGPLGRDDSATATNDETTGRTATVDSVKAQDGFRDEPAAILPGSLPAPIVDNE